ncbi:unnamed protein product [Nezara viridula]|uniref:Uncharacterized protein n=1 Tax=Nezara viridula TaxID=85310 RepID=A0A9P0HJZ8_NEZVI|nr:unnamed protein product [Nezara viridula]
MQRSRLKRNPSDRYHKKEEVYRDESGWRFCLNNDNTISRYPAIIGKGIPSRGPEVLLIQDAEVSLPQEPARPWNTKSKKTSGGNNRR